MRTSRRAVLYGIMGGGISVASVSTAAYTGVSISSLTWAELSAYSKAISRDTAHVYSNAIRSVTFSDGQVLGVGDYLNISINSVSFRVDILEFHHDTVTNYAAYGGTYAGISWQMHDLYTTRYSMNSTDTNVGGWTNCQMRTSTMATLLGLLSNDLSGMIVPVDKLTGAGNKSSTIVTTSDSLFLLSEIEIFGSSNFSASGEGSIYAYYAAGNSRLKKLSGTNGYWLERSPTTSSASYWCAVNTTGAGNSSNRIGSQTSGVAFAFCT